MTGWFLLAAFLLLAANAFFVAVEFALLASRAARLESMAGDDGDARTRAALASIRNLQPQLAGAQLGITMASLGLGFVAEPAIAHLLEAGIDAVVSLPSGVLHTVSFVVALALVVVVHMVIGEMVPKNLAIAAPEQSARLLAPLHRGYVTLFRPVVWVLNSSSNAISRLLGMEPVDELNTALTVNEFQTLLRGAVEEGKLEDAEGDLLSGALDLRARTVASIMVPRWRMVTINRETTIAELETLVNERGHSRVPVIGNRSDDVIGFVHSKDLLRFGAGDHGAPVPLEMLRRMLIVDPNLPVRQLIFLMSRARRHLAVVRSSDGRLLGMVTLEDALEALVGDIVDETDGGLGLSADS